MASGDGHLGGPITGDEGGAEPDGAGAEHQHPIVGLHVGQADAVHGDGQRLGERGRDRVDAVGDRRQVDQRGVDDLGQPAVAPEADARAALAAQVGAPALAERARPAAGDVGGHGVAHVGQTGRPVHDDAGQLVARRRAERLADLAVEEVEVAPADPARLHPQPHPPRLERPRLVVDDVDAVVRPDRTAHAVDGTHRDVRPRADVGDASARALRALASGDLGAECVEALLPEAPKGIEPGVDLLQGLGRGRRCAACRRGARSRSRARAAPGGAARPPAGTGRTRPGSRRRPRRRCARRRRGAR